MAVAECATESILVKVKAFPRNGNGQVRGRFCSKICF